MNVFLLLLWERMRSVSKKGTNKERTQVHARERKGMNILLLPETHAMNLFSACATLDVVVR